MKNKNTLFLAMLLILLSTNCKKEDIVPPKISITFLSEQSSFSVGDEIEIKVRVTDDISVKSLSITLLDEKRRVVGNTQRFEPNENDFSINIKYHIADTTLESGDYLLNFRAFDSQNESVKTIGIRIVGIPKKNLGIFAITQPTESQTIIYTIAPNGNYSTWMQNAGDYLFSAMDSKCQQLYLFPKYIGNMKALNINTQNMIWSIPKFGTPPNIWFKGIKLHENNLYVAEEQSIVKVYDHIGYVINQFNVLENYNAVNFLLHDNHYFLFEVSKIGSVPNRIVGLNQGLMPILNMTVNFDLINWFPKDKNTIFLFYNTSTGIEISTMYYSTGGIQTQKMEAGIKLYDVEFVENNKFLLATSRGILFYNYESGNSMVTLINKSDVTEVEKNITAGYFTASSGNEIFSFTMPYGNIVQSISIPDSVCKFHIYYNK